MNKMRKKKTAVWFYPEIDEIDDVDAKQYHRASFSTRNSALNTSLRKPIRMQDFIQLCDSVQNVMKLSCPVLSCLVGFKEYFCRKSNPC